MFHPKLSFSFHAEVDRDVDIANENWFRIKENKSVFCEVVTRVVAFLAPTLLCCSPLSTVSRCRLLDLPKFLWSSILRSMYRHVCVHTHTLDSGVLIWRTQPYSSSVRIICISQLISMSTPGIWFEARWGRHSRTALEEGSDTSAPQRCPGQ